ncbi:hypothetical protein MIMGU_mgv1a004777mg [Erythranthe guttata]|uniref:Protein CHUP1, chloroplastic n=1 Tax=Erythranthe guttata TaxID=4155 RepID=A0A022Q096_ERYGU|nr:hypothetical protein MIMGU_mgv1a004777mg [Erythranthe guttata]
MAVRDKRDISINPVIIKFGLALALSIGGIVYTFFRSKRIKPSEPKPSLPNPGKNSRVDSREDIDRALQDISLLKVSPRNSISDNLPSSRRSNEDRGGDFLSHELNQLVREYETAVTTDDVSPGTNMQSLEEHEIEIRNLRSKVEILEEREILLENQLHMCHYDLRAEESAVAELQNRLRLHNMEVKQYNLKIETLQLDKIKLEEKVADYANVVKELESAKAKIKMLRKKLTFDAEQNREQILNLKERIQALKEENQLLRQQKDDLSKEIEQMQSDRCTDIEELVYLRWINACLRYEMRNHQPAAGKTIARDLSKTLSPESEKKAKQLILEYAHKEGTGPADINITDFDSDRWSFSQGSYDDLFVENSSENKTNHPTKTRVFGKLMKLWRGKDSLNHIQTTLDVSENESGGGLVKTTRTSSVGGRSAHSLDIQRSSYSRGPKSTNGESSNCSRRISEDGSLSIFKTIDSEYDESHQNAQNDAEKKELVKYAEALKGSRVKSQYGRRSASFAL